MPNPGPLPQTSHTAATPNTTCREFTIGHAGRSEQSSQARQSPGNLPRVLTRGRGAKSGAQPHHSAGISPSFRRSADHTSAPWTP
jgi:hypothetical protein